MRTRHRIPTIFNLSMVDVLCCALGCVILLWLLNFREAKRRAAAAGQSNVALNQTQSKLDQTRSQLDQSALDLADLRAQFTALERQADASSAQLKRTTGERDRLLKDLDAARIRVTELTQEKTVLTTERDRLVKDLDTSKTRLTDLTRESTLLTSQRDQLAKDLDLAKTQGAGLTKDKLALKSAHDLLTDLLVQKTKEGDALSRDLKTTQERVEDLNALLKSKDGQVTVAVKSADALTLSLRQAEQRVKDLQTQADLLPGLRADAKTLRDKLTLAEERARNLDFDLMARQKELASAQADLRALEQSKGTLAKDVMARAKELAAAQQQVELLQGESRRLADVANRLRLDADNRFAGISLTGRRVLFLVDMSGSMELLDDNSVAPGKWQVVCDTLAKVLRSLPDLEKFQVVTFSDKAQFPLGGADRWLDYDSAASGEQVLRALTGIKPTGNTNMYAAFEQACRFRPAGLDTIYVLSDGLPNIGEGLPTVGASGNIRENERTDLLSRHVRKTLLNTWNRSLPGQPRVRIHTIGFFYESPAVGAFLWALSRENDGSFVGMSKP
jgi:hypothetical protein